MSGYTRRVDVFLGRIPRRHTRSQNIPLLRVQVFPRSQMTCQNSLIVFEVMQCILSSTFVLTGMGKEVGVHGLQFRHTIGMYQLVASSTDGGRWTWQADRCKFLRSSDDLGDVAVLS